MCGRQGESKRIFLLSPADCGGQRARLVLNRAATFDLAVRLRGQRGAPLGEVFSFLSGLYFRGKLAYARAFARPPRAVEGVNVITAGDGLQPADAYVTLAHPERYAATAVALHEPRYRQPLERDALRLGSRLGADCELVLLGSIASRKYLEILIATLGDRLRLPRELIGLGDMSRGALLLRCVAERRELTYLRIGDVGRSLSLRGLRIEG